VSRLHAKIVDNRIAAGLDALAKWLSCCSAARNCRQSGAIGPVESRRGECGAAAVTISDRIFARFRKAIVEGEIPRSKISEPELAREWASAAARCASDRAARACNLLVRRPMSAPRRQPVGARLARAVRRARALESTAARLARSGWRTRRSRAARAARAAARARARSRKGWPTSSARATWTSTTDRPGSKNARLIACSATTCTTWCGCTLPVRHGEPAREAAFVEHEHIVNAIADRDSQLAELLMRRHIAPRGRTSSASWW